VAVFRCLPGKQGGYTSGTFKTVLLANNLIHRRSEDAPSISGEDVKKCKELAKKKKSIFDLLAKSLAPSIHGHDYVKKALLCMLLGGVEKILPNGSRLRGDINILLIGKSFNPTIVYTLPLTLTQSSGSVGLVLYSEYYLYLYCLNVRRALPFGRIQAIVSNLELVFRRS
jgi:MCM P-loop domain